MELHARNDGAFALELCGVSFVSTLFAKLQACAEMVFEQTVLGTELAVAVGTVAHHSERCQRAALEQAPVLLGLLLGGTHGGRRQPRRGHRGIRGVAHENDCIVASGCHSKLFERLVQGRELLAIVNQLVVSG